MNNDNQTQILTAIYTAERADNQNTLAQTLVLTSILVAYSAGLGAIGATNPNLYTDLYWLLPLLPFPAVSAAAMHLLLFSLAYAHNASIEVIETKLLSPVHLPVTDAQGQHQLDRNGAPLSHTTWVGARSGREVSDLARIKNFERWPLGVATALSYGGAALVVAGFTVTCIALPIARGSGLCIPVIAGTLYVFAAIALWCGYRRALGINPDVMRKYAGTASPN